jgi:hypothetical protein
MANEKFILAKVQRNLEQMGVTVVVNATSIAVDDVVLTLEDPAIQAPMGGVDGSVSPFIGIGVANPNVMVLTCANDVPPLTDGEVKLLAVCARFANSIKINDSSNALLMFVPGHADLIGMGQ